MDKMNYYLYEATQRREKHINANSEGYIKGAGG